MMRCMEDFHPKTGGPNIARGLISLPCLKAILSVVLSPVYPIKPMSVDMWCLLNCKPYSNIVSIKIDFPYLHSFLYHFSLS